MTGEIHAGDVRRNRRLGLAKAVLLTVGVALAAGACGGGSGGSGASGWDYVMVPEKVHFGATYAEWSARWWQWAVELPYSTHPLFDRTGENAWQGQVDPVWYIGGVFGTPYGAPPGYAERSVTLPSGIALFFPIVNVEWDNDYCTPPDWVPLPGTELRQWAYDAISTVQNVFCEIDGASIIDSPDLAGCVRFRAAAGEFGALMPADNLSASCGWPPGPILVDPMFSDGVWMMVAPMPPGEHTIHFGGTFPGDPPFALDITYHVTVTP